MVGNSSAKPNPIIGERSECQSRAFMFNQGFVIILKWKILIKIIGFVHREQELDFKLTVDGILGRLYQATFALWPGSIK